MNMHVYIYIYIHCIYIYIHTECISEWFFNNCGISLATLGVTFWTWEFPIFYSYGDPNSDDHPSSSVLFTIGMTPYGKSGISLNSIWNNVSLSIILLIIMVISIVIMNITLLRVIPTRTLMCHSFWHIIWKNGNVVKTKINHLPNPQINGWYKPFPLMDGLLLF